MPCASRARPGWKLSVGAGRTIGFGGSARPGQGHRVVDVVHAAAGGDFRQPSGVQEILPVLSLDTRLDATTGVPLYPLPSSHKLFAPSTTVTISTVPASRLVIVRFRYVPISLG